MTAANFAASLAHVGVSEGGWSDDARDPGNWTGGKPGLGILKGTNHGIAANTYPDLDIRSLTKAQAAAIYHRDFWSPGDHLPDGIDLAYFDAAINSGGKPAARWLQHGLGVTADGRIGPQTLGAARGVADGVAVIQRAVAARMGFLRGLGTWKTYQHGWSKRLASVEATGAAMWLAAHGPGVASPRLQGEADKADKAATGAQAGAGAAGAGGAVAPVADMPAGLVAFLILLSVVVAVILIQRGRHDRERARAYRRVGFLDELARDGVRAKKEDEVDP